MTPSQIRVATPSTNRDTLHKPKEKLLLETKAYRANLRLRQLWHTLLRHGLLIINVTLSALVTIVGALDKSVFGLSPAHVAAVLGAFLTALVTVNQVYPFTDMAFFYRSTIGELDNLITEFDMAGESDKELDKALKLFVKLRKHIADDLPRGKAFDEQTKAQALQPGNEPYEIGSPSMDANGKIKRGKIRQSRGTHL